ncbi:ABC-type Fe3+-siderophore transport system [unidentified eubacterium SCB49]|nr:ABC-type Fe3+-siderophore transport system [unidentified eubacterium SCB49]
MIVKDQLHRTLTFSETPRRIVSLVPSQTELLVDLGLRDYIVGITKFCVHPKELRQQSTIVGGTKTIHIDKIAALKPDIIICNKEENTQEIVAQCEAIAPVWVSDIKDVAGNNEMILLLGDLLGVKIKAHNLVAAINQAQQEFEVYVKNRAHKNITYLIWKSPYMAAGKDTFINYLLELNGFSNSVKNKEGRYPEINISDLKTADVVFLSSEPYPFKEKDVLEIKNALDKPVHLVDGEYFSWYGSRLLGAFDYFKTLL